MRTSRRVPDRFPIAPPIEPMLAKLAEALPEAGAFLFEPKWDGFRAIVFRSASDVYIQSRDLTPLARYFPELHDSLLEQRVVQFRKITVERLQVAALDVDVRGAAKHDGAEPVPLGLEQKGPRLGQRLSQLGEHRLDRRGDGKSVRDAS